MRSLNAASQQPPGCVSKQAKSSGVEDPVKVFVGSIPAGSTELFAFLLTLLSSYRRGARLKVTLLSLFFYDGVRLISTADLGYFKVWRT